MFYRVDLSYPYLVIFSVLPAILCINNILLNGIAKMYYSHINALSFVLVYLVCIQSGVTTFVQSALYYIYVSAVFTFSYIYQYSRAYSQGQISEEDRVSLVGYLVYFYLSGGFILINNYIYLGAEIATFNNSHLGAKNSAKIESFVDRLLPKHVRPE